MNGTHELKMAGFDIITIEDLYKFRKAGHPNYSIAVIDARNDGELVGGIGLPAAYRSADLVLRHLHW